MEIERITGSGDMLGDQKLKMKGIGGECFLRD